jgi:hypothetical protein
MIRTSGRCWRVDTGYVKFPATVEADPVCAVFDCEGAAQVTVPATENKLEDAQE